MTSAQAILLQIDSRLECVAGLGARINALCCEHGMDEVNSYQVQTAVTEAVNNAIIHAYDNQPGHRVSLDWTLQDQIICIEVSDEGKRMPKIPPDIKPSPEAESGRGWWIMRRWMDQVDYASGNGQNRLIMYRKI
ncbi:MAG: serine/threonine-protein kinase RsbW [Gammaproteobacteria bacterium]|jgi:serine/threonine-protein kinase RsbW